MVSRIVGLQAAADSPQGTCAPVIKSIFYAYLWPLAGIVNMRCVTRDEMRGF
jgi:hypothetical protein